MTNSGSLMTRILKTNTKISQCTSQIVMYIARNRDKMGGSTTKENPTMMHISLDIDYNADSDFKRFLDLNDIHIQTYIENGPAGGNPYYEIFLDSPEKLTEFAKFYALHDLSTYFIDKT